MSELIIIDEIARSFKKEKFHHANDVLMETSEDPLLNVIVNDPAMFKATVDKLAYEKILVEDSNKNDSIFLDLQAGNKLFERIDNLKRIFMELRNLEDFKNRIFTNERASLTSIF